MIILDVNVLIYAFDRGAERHERYAEWVTKAVTGEEIVALADPVLTGFLRIVTSSRIYPQPASAEVAMEFVTAVIEAPATEWLAGSHSSWRVLNDLIVDDPQITGNLVPDAYLAALTIAHGGSLATADRGFRRYPSLRWFDPVAG